MVVCTSRRTKTVVGPMLALHLLGLILSSILALDVALVVLPLMSFCMWLVCNINKMLATEKIMLPCISETFSPAKNITFKNWLVVMVLSSVMHYGEYAFTNYRPQWYEFWKSAAKTIDSRGHRCGQRNGTSLIFLKSFGTMLLPLQLVIYQKPMKWAKQHDSLQPNIRHKARL